MSKIVNNPLHSVNSWCKYNFFSCMKPILQDCVRKNMSSLMTKCNGRKFTLSVFIEIIH
jgi:hypothetical protein